MATKKTAAQAAQDVAAIEAEAADREDEDAEPDPYTVTADLAGHEVRVLPATRWRASVLRAANTGDYEAFFTAVLHPDDLDVFYDADPEQGDTIDFIGYLNQLASQDAGKFGRRGGSSRTTRRR